MLPVLLPCHCPAALLPLVLLQGLSALGLAHSPGVAVPGLQQGQAMGTAGAALTPQGRAWGLQAPCPGSLKSTPRPVLSRENPREQPQGGRGQGGGKEQGWCSAGSLGEPGRSSRAGADPSPLRWTPQGSVPERPHAPASNIPPLQPWPLPSSERGWILAGTDTAGLAQEPLFALPSPGVSTPRCWCGEMNLREHKCHQPLGASKGWGTAGKPLSFVVASQVSQKVCSHQL